jgi:hypothetical protein
MQMDFRKGKLNRIEEVCGRLRFYELTATF